MKLFDSHCHLDDRVYDKDIDEVIKRTNKASVSAAIYPHDAKDCS